MQPAYPAVLQTAGVATGGRIQSPAPPEAHSLMQLVLGGVRGYALGISQCGLSTRDCQLGELDVVEPSPVLRRCPSKLQ